MTFSPSDLPLGDAKSATGFEPFMAAAFAPAMMTSAMIMEGYAFWMQAARGMMPMFDDIKATPLDMMPKGIDVPETVVEAFSPKDEVAINEPADLLVAEPFAEAVAPAAVLEGQKPVGLAEARDSMGDDLSLISGIGPKIEKKLHDLGFFHWDQIAEWTADEVTWVDSFLDFKGRIAREDWQSQAEALALGGVEEYVKRFGKEPR